MTFWTADNVRGAAGGRWLVEPTERGGRVSGVVTDTRAMGSAADVGSVFVALRGEHFDAHTFLADACRGDAGMLIVDRAESVDDDTRSAMAQRGGVVHVDDTGAALLELASAYRRALGAHGTKFVVVTGSSGKTTTTRFIDAVLGPGGGRLVGTSSPKSFNNAVGVPLTILGAREGGAYVVCEAGVNEPGEMEVLGRTIEPDVAIITTIGSAHAELLGGPEGVAREKCVLLKHLQPDGVAVLDADSHWIDAHVSCLPGTCHVLRFGSTPSADVRLIRSESRCDEMHQRWRGVFTYLAGDGQQHEATLPAVGTHNAHNALAAIAVGQWFGISREQAHAGLACAQLPAMRSQIQVFSTGDHTITLINDCYNANPESVAAALETLVQVGAGAVRRVAVLGDMRELGALEGEAHRRVGQQVAADRSIDTLVCVGDAMQAAADAARSMRHGDTLCIAHIDGIADDADAQRLAATIQPGDCVLIKGSRAMGLERVAEAIRQRFTQECQAHA